MRRHKLEVSEKVGKLKFAFSMNWAREGLKNRLAKAAGAEPSGQMTNEKLHAMGSRNRGGR